MIGTVGLKAYTTALRNFAKAEQSVNANALKPQAQPVSSFSDTLGESISKVNDMQTEKKQMIQSFASGEHQNVHELMISMQKAGLAMNMTAAVRNKVMEAYRELSRMQF
jgi:flagellar hook-basal body complex protein FliE